MRIVGQYSTSISRLTLFSTSDLVDQIQRLQTQLDELSSQFSGPDDTTTTSSSLAKPKDPALSSDFSAATSRPRRSQQPRSSSLRKQAQSHSPSPKSVRFRDNPSSAAAGATEEEDEASRAALFDRPYRDDPSRNPGYADQPELDNQQIHTFHKTVMREQDDQLDVLGQSIRRQRDLSVQMGTELDEQGLLLHDVEGGVDRHQSTLDRAKGRLGKVSRGAKNNWSWVTIGILIVLLVLLILLLKT